MLLFNICSCEELATYLHWLEYKNVFFQVNYFIRLKLSLCKNINETMRKLFATYILQNSIWKKTLHLMIPNNNDDGDDIRKCYKFCNAQEFSRVAKLASLFCIFLLLFYCCFHLPILCNLTFGIVICFILSNKTMRVSLSLFGWESLHILGKKSSLFWKNLFVVKKSTLRRLWGLCTFWWRQINKDQENQHGFPFVYVQAD